MQSLTYVISAVLLAAPQLVGCVHLRNESAVSELQEEEFDASDGASGWGWNRRRDSRRRQCKIGNYREGCDNNQCKACPTGKYQGDQTDEGHCHCDTCVEGTHVNGDRTACDACPEGKWSARGQSSCNPWTVCNAGSDSHDGDRTRDRSCAPCGMGRFSETGITCLPCEAGKAQGTEGQASCEVCGEGTHSQPEASGCNACLLGKAAGPGEAFCTSCTAGKYAAAGSAECQSCPVGKFSAEDAGDCTSCTAGKWAQAEATQCLSCEPGSFSGDLSEECTECSEGEFQANHGASACTQCEKGNYAGSKGTAEEGCTQCAPGNYVDQQGASEQTPCDPGTNQSAHGQDKCDDCPAGTHQSQAGMNHCTLASECVTGKEVFAASTSILDTICQACAPGKFSDDAGGCKPCPKGYAEAYAGSGQCTFCGIGQVVAVLAQNEGNIACEACPVGKSSCADANIPECTECNDCDAGSAGHVHCTGDDCKSECHKCIAGSFAPTPGGDSCQQCPKGSFVSGQGATECESCPVGKHNSQPGGAVCSDCSRGKFMDIPNSWESDCPECSIGSFAEAAGSSVCSACSSGKQATTSGSSACEDVAAASTYASQQGAGDAPWNLWGSLTVGNAMSSEFSYQ